MGAWKSSDGGSITPLGASSISADYAANTVLVSAGVNVRGVTIRSAMISGGAGSYGFLKAGGARIIGFSIQYERMLLPYEIFVPAGLAVEVERTAGTLSVGMTYDIH